MEAQDRKNVPFKFADPRQLRIFEQLSRIGPGPAAFFRDACLLVESADVIGLESASHLIGHLAREIEDSIREVLLPLSERPEKPLARATGSEDTKAQIRTILEMLEIPETDPIASLWFLFKDRDKPDALHKLAHRRNLEAPRPTDQQFQIWWINFQTFLVTILEGLEAHHLKVIRLLDDLFVRVQDIVNTF